MKKEKPLNNKERRALGSKLRKKLIELGIQDTIIMKATAKLRQVLTIENGKIVVKKVPSMMAANLNRTMTKKFLKMSRSEIARFLATTVEDMKALAAKSKPAPEAAAKTENG